MKIYVRVFVWTHVFIFFVLFLFLKYLGVELLGCMVVPCLTFGGTDKVFSTVATPFYIPTTDVQGFQFLHILTSTCYFPFRFVLIIVALVGVRQYLIVVWICLSLMTVMLSIFDLLLGHSCIFFGKKCQFKPFAYFLTGLFVFLLLSCKSSLYILILNPYQIYDLQIFSPIL